MRFECRNCHRYFDARPPKCPACGRGRIRDLCKRAEAQGLLKCLDKIHTDLDAALRVVERSRIAGRGCALRDLKRSKKMMIDIAVRLGDARPELAGALERKVLEAKASSTSCTLT